jgi:beta-fructofuranosidase
MQNPNTYGMTAKPGVLCVAVIGLLLAITGQPTFSEEHANAVPQINGPYVRIYSPGKDVFPGPDTEHFKAGQSYAEWVPNDHTIIKGPDGCWHLFGITHPKPDDFNPPSYNPATVHEAECLFFHAVSPKGKLKEQLKEGLWQDAPKVLAPGSRPGEIPEAYAPFAIRQNDLFKMVYGPTDLRMATSTDLYNWKPSGTLFSQEGAARDPSIFRYDNRYVMIYVAGTSIFARTSEDALHWTGQPIEILRLPQVAPESPSIVEHDGAWYLFYCIYNGADEVNGAYDYRTYVHRSTTPYGFFGTSPVAELKSHAPEVFQDEDGDWFITSVEWPQRGVSIAPLTWR